MVKTLRPYQDAAQTSLLKYLFDNPKKNPLVVAPVAAGKSLMIAEFAKTIQGYYPRLRIVVLTHVKELLVQNHAELMGQYKDADTGFYCAGLGQKRLHNDITFASIQSVHNKITAFPRVPEIIIIDECHLISHKSSTQYRKFIDSVLHLNPNCRIIGYTGTPFRADTGRLDEGKNKLFDDIAYEIGMDYMIDEGYWARPVVPKIATKMDVSGVNVRGGDYVAGELERAVNTESLNNACVKELIEHGINRNKWLIFTAGVQHAEEVTKELNKAGISARYVHSDQDAKINDQNLIDHKAGKFKALVNIAKLTTGYNDPEIDLLCFMRPTRSPVLYIQMTGRGVRTVYAEGYDLSTKEGRLEAIANSTKPDCMIVDFGGVVAELGAIDTVTIRKKWQGETETEGTGEAITKICPSCGTECPAARRYCLSCGYCFIVLDDKASEKAVVSSDIEPEWYDVLDVQHDRHNKEGSRPSMAVSYYTMVGQIREWVCFEHHFFEGNKKYAWEMAQKWHKKRLPDIDVPMSVDEALQIEYPRPSKVLIRKKGKYYEVLDCEWNEPDEQPQPETLTLDHDFNPFEIPF